MSHALLAEIWLWLLALILILTVVLDGFDLGVGLLVLAQPDEARRAELMESIEGVWHANQTWLVVLGGVLFGAFPLAYGQLLTWLALPAGLMLLGLMARGVGLEYYAHATLKRPWSTLFGLGSLLTLLGQGAMLGAVMQGGPPGVFGWLTPGAFLGALALACAAGALGAGWAAMRAPDCAPHRPGLVLLAGSAIFQLGLLTAVPVQGPAGLALGCAAAAYCAWGMVAAGSRARFFLPACLYVAASLTAWLAGLRPGFAAPGKTPVDAAAAPGSLTIMLWGFGLVLPVIAVYTVYQYRVFRGRGGYGPADADA